MQDTVTTLDLKPPVTTTGSIRALFFYLDYGAIGGIERYILEMTTRLAQKGSVQPIVACSEGGWLAKMLQAEGIPAFGIQSHPRWSGSVLRMFDFSALRQLREILRQTQPDLIHVHIGLFENLWLQRLGFPVVYTVHGYSTLYAIPEGLNRVKTFCKRLIRFLFRQTARRMDRLLFVSRSEQERMLHEGFITEQCQGTVLHNGLDIASWQEKIRRVDVQAVKAKLNIPENARVVSFINRLDPNKNPLHVIELAKAILADPAYQDVHFLIAGEGLQSGLVRLHALFSPQVKLLGYHPDIPELIAASDLIVYPSEREGFGLGLLEAMAAGRLCLAYESGGAREILDTDETRSCLTPIGSIQLLTAKAKTWLAFSPPEQRELCQALKQRAEAFDIRNTLAQLEAVYQTVQPLVSVILPVYQGEATILRAVESVLKQDYTRLELIVVDDGSTDNTLTQLQTITDSRLKIIRQPNRGVAHARNHALTQAQGEYMAFIDADDVWLPHKLRTELKIIRRAKNPVGLIYSSYYAVDENNRLVNLPKIRTQTGDLSHTVLEDEGLFLPSTTLMHRTIFETIGGFQAGCYHEDRAFFIRAAQRFPAYPTKKRLVLYRQSMSGRCRKVLQNGSDALQAELSIIQALQEVLPAPQLAFLKFKQLQNLMFRFLMYGHLDSARKIEAMLPPSLPVFEKKELLAWFSLRLNINLLSGLRICMQQVMRLRKIPC